MDRRSRPRKRTAGNCRPDDLNERRRFLAGLTAFALSPFLFTVLPGCRRARSTDQVLDLDATDLIPPHPPIPEVEPFIRVRVGRIRSTHEGDEEQDAEVERDAADIDAQKNGLAPVIVIGETGQMLRVVQPDRMKRYFAAYAPLEISIGPAGWSMTDARGLRLPIYDLSYVHILPLERETDGEHLALDGRQYPGMLTLVPMTHDDPVAFDVVNHVRMEEYLPGVVERELYNHWHLETHAAQAIAARSFACAERAWWAERRHFDLTDTQASQVYAGAVTHRTSLEAVGATRGVVLAHNDYLVPAYYSSCCGGLPARAIDAIGPNPINDIPPLRGNGNGEEDVCLSAPVARWQFKYSRHLISRRIAGFGEAQNNRELAALKTLQSIDVAAVNEHNRPTRYLLVDSVGTEVMIAAEALRRAINSADGKMERLPRPLRSSHFTVEADGRDFIMTGRGFGHGVGMCQHGAQIRARSGASHREILQWYYPGAELVQAYG